MTKPIIVYVNDSAITIYAGMQVKHALIARDESLYTAACNDEIVVIDDNGFHIGLEGSLRDGARIYTRPLDT